MATQFSGGTYVNTTFLGETKQNIIDNIETALLGAGWNTVSGHTTTNLLMQSAAQPNVTNPIRVRINDTGGTSINVHVENQSGTIKSAHQTTSGYGGPLIPAVGKTFQIIATQYHFLCFKPTATPVMGGDFVMAGMLWSPSFLSMTDQGYVFSNSNGDSDTTQRGSFRDGFLLGGGRTTGNSIGNWEVLYNTSFFETLQYPGYGGYPGVPEALVMNGVYGNNGITKGYRWGNDDLNTSDVLCMYAFALNDEGKIRGQFFDMLFIGSAFSMDITDTFGGHNWQNLTNNNTGNNANPWMMSGGIWVATS